MHIMLVKTNIFMVHRGVGSANLVRYSATPLLADSLNGSGVAEAVSIPKKLRSSGERTQKIQKRYSLPKVVEGAC